MRPILFHIGPVPVFTYGFLISVGFFIAYFAINRKAAKLGIDEDHVTNLFLVCVFWCIACARVLYVAHNWSHYRKDWITALQIWDGGLVFFGGLLGGLAGFWWYCRRSGLSVPRVMDLFAPYLALAHAFGRLGCFGYGCCFGTHSTLPWAMKFPFTDTVKPLLPRHPTQLYAAAFLLVLYGALAYFWERRPWDGSVSLAYGYAYGTFRFLIEFIRGDNVEEHFLLGLTMAQSISLVGLALLGLVHWRLARGAEDGRRGKPVPNVPR